MEWVNSTMIYWKNFCNCHNVPQYNNNIIIKNKLKRDEVIRLESEFYKMDGVCACSEGELIGLQVQAQP
jgi:hypothetical protein